MNIVYLCNAKSHHFVRWYEFFLRRGHQVTVISGDTRLNNQDVRLPPTVDVHHLPESRYEDGRVSFMVNLVRLPLIVSKLKRLLALIQPDLVHAHSIRYGLWAAAAGARPLIVTPYGSDAIVNTRRYALYRAIAKYVYTRCDAITQDSVECLRASLELGTAHAMNHIIVNGVDLTRFSGSPNRDAARARFGLAAKFVVLHARELEPLYNVSGLLDGFAKFATYVPEAVLVLAYLRTGTAYEQRLRDQAAALRIVDRVKFLGAVAHAEIDALHAAAHVFVSIPLSDSMPSSVGEAMASGTPTILSRLRWTDWFMRDGENGILVDGTRAASVAAALSRCYGDEVFRARVAQGGRDTAKRYFDYNENMRRMEQIMEDLIKRRSVDSTRADLLPEEYI